MDVKIIYFKFYLQNMGSLSHLYENSTGSSVTVKFCPCIRNQGVNWAWYTTDTIHRINFTVVSIQG